jgi:hypothetical protein
MKYIVRSPIDIRRHVEHARGAECRHAQMSYCVLILPTRTCVCQVNYTRNKEGHERAKCNAVSHVRLDRSPFYRLKITVGPWALLNYFNKSAMKIQSQNILFFQAGSSFGGGVIVLSHVHWLLFDGGRGEGQYLSVNSRACAVFPSAK